MNLPSDPQEAVRLLAEQVNRLNGQVAAIRAFLVSIKLEPEDAEEMKKLAAELTPRQITFSGPRVVENSSLTTAYFLLRKREPA